MDTNTAQMLTLPNAPLVSETQYGIPGKSLKPQLQ